MVSDSRLGTICIVSQAASWFSNLHASVHVNAFVISCVVLFCKSNTVYKILFKLNYCTGMQFQPPNLGIPIVREGKHSAATIRVLHRESNISQASNGIHPRKRHNNPTNRHTPSRIKSTHTHLCVLDLSRDSKGAP